MKEDKITKQEDTVARKIWDHIKSVDLHMFSLKNQTVEKNCEFAIVEPSKLYVVLKSSSVLTALEEYVAPLGYTISTLDKYVVIERKQ